MRHEGDKLMAQAKAVYEAILENGPLDTVRLRREARMSAKSAKSRFDRARRATGRAQGAAHRCGAPRRVELIYELFHIPVLGAPPPASLGLSILGLSLRVFIVSEELACRKAVIAAHAPRQRWPSASVLRQSLECAPA
jgi:hypothetical protein